MYQEFKTSQNDGQSTANLSAPQVVLVPDPTLQPEAVLLPEAALLPEATMLPGMDDASPSHHDTIIVASPPLTPVEVVPMLIGATVGEVEQELVLQTLAHCDGNRTHAARVLGISVRTLRNKIRVYTAIGIDVPAHV